MRYRPDIDGLRAVAVLSVLLFHAGLGFPGGFVGVDVFFVISGYLITGVLRSGLEAGDFSFRDFWRRRIARIAPAATACTLATVVAGWFLLIPADMAELASSAVAQQLAMANLYFSSRVGYFDGPADLKPLLHMWSLAVEEQFYVFYPFVLVGLWRWRPRLVPLTLGVFASASFVWSINRLESSPSAAFFLLPSRSWELLIGCLIHWIPAIPGDRIKLRAFLSLLGLGGILTAALCYTNETPFPATAALLPCVGTAMLIHCGGIGHWMDRILSLRVLVFIGLISYSLYLIHWPIIVYLRYEWGFEVPMAGRLAAVAASVGLAALSWWLIENPLRRFGAALPFRRVLATFAASVVIVGGVSLLISLLEGVPGRLPPNVAAVAKTPRITADQDRTAAQIRAGEIPLFGDHDGGIDCLVWGDSHARAIHEAFEASCIELGIGGAVVSRSATPPLLNVWFNRADSSAAPEWNEAVLEFIRAKRVRVVVLAARWSVYMGQDNPSPGQVARVARDSASVGGDPEDGERVVRDGLARTIQAILDEGVVGIVVLREFPLQPIAGPRLMVSELLTGRPSPLVATRADHLVHQASVERVLSSVQDRFDIALVDPSRHLFVDESPDSPTLVGDAGGAYYSDEDHPSSYGAVRIIARDLTEAIRRMSRSREGP
jgi:peptidoglycan/LPS O-acetylase OafA/YrhL